MHIPTDALLLLDVIERRGSFAKAAEELERATSAVSYGVQRLEDQLGITIFERQGRRSVLTPAGRLLLEEGRVILAASFRLADRARELANGWETTLRIGLEATLNPETFFSVLTRFQDDHPSIEIDVSEWLLNGSWEALARQQVDLLVGAVAPVPAHQGLRAERFGHAHLVPVISSSHRDIDAIMASGDHSEVRRIVNHDPVTNEVARNEGFDLAGRRTLYAQTMAQKLWAVKAGLGTGHLPLHAVAEEIERGTLISLPAPASEPEQFIAYPISNKGKGLRTLVQMLLAALATSPREAE